MQKIDPEEFRKRLEQMTELFSGMVTHADELSRQRCPYKNRHNQCTANFGCRNQRRAPVKGERLLCGGDDKLDYRSAWEAGVARRP